MASRVRLVTCIKRRLGAAQRSRAASGRLALIDQIGRLIETRGLTAPVRRCECLGRCEQGSALHSAPFFTGIGDAALVLVVGELEAFVAAGHAADS